jgi:hypothetical protein
MSMSVEAWLNIPGALASILVLIDRFQKPDKQKWSRTLSAAVWLMFLATIFTTFWSVYHPRVVTNTVTVEKTVDRVVQKTVPCPPNKTGAATVKGNNGIANSGVIGGDANVTPDAGKNKKQ